MAIKVKLLNWAFVSAGCKKDNPITTKGKRLTHGIFIMTPLIDFSLNISKGLHKMSSFIAKILKELKQIMYQSGNVFFENSSKILWRCCTGSDGHKVNIIRMLP